MDLQNPVVSTVVLIRFCGSIASDILGNGKMLERPAFVSHFEFNAVSVYSDGLESRKDEKGNCFDSSTGTNW